MRKLSLCLMIVALCVVPTLAASPRKVRTPSTQPASKPTTRTLRGEITAINIETKTITTRIAARQAQSEEVTLTTNEQTRFTLDGSAVTLVDLKPDMQVVVQSDAGVAVQVTAKSVVKTKPKVSKNAVTTIR